MSSLRTLTAKPATCHPEERAFARGLCIKCYRSWAKKAHKNGTFIALRQPKTEQERLDKRDDQVRKYRYKLSLEGYNRMAFEQDNKCAICKRPAPESKRLHVDHNHATGRIRGLLCNRCNTAIYPFDNKEFLERILAYLQISLPVANVEEQPALNKGTLYD
jgi:hypothetical protein